MLREAETALCLGVLLIVAGCASTGVVPIGSDTYMIGKRSAQAGFGPPVQAQADVYKEATAYCAKQGKSLETVKLDAQDSGFARPGSVQLQFRCVESK
jgi:putative hemolysin